MKCFYHSADLDGHCAGAIVRMRYWDCEMIGIDYGQPFPWERIEPGEQVFMVDFSLQPFIDMVRLAGMCNLIWIDHHKSAIDESQKVLTFFQGIRNNEKAGCELTWAYLYPSADMPMAVRLLGRYDVWDHQDPAILPFQYGFRTKSTDPASRDAMQEIWSGFLLPGDTAKWLCWDVVDAGRKILAPIRSGNEKLCKVGAFDAEIDGLKVVAINKLIGSFQVFESVWDPARYHAMCCFGRRADGKWTVSLYSTRPDVDVSEICKARGGGGHKGAAGFQTLYLIPELGGYVGEAALALAPDVE